MQKAQTPNRHPPSTPEHQISFLSYIILEKKNQIFCMLKPNPNPNPQLRNPATTRKKKRTKPHHCYPRAGTPWPKPFNNKPPIEPKKLGRRSSEVGRNARRGPVHRKLGQRRPAGMRKAGAETGGEGFKKKGRPPWERGSEGLGEY